MSEPEFERYLEDVAARLRLPSHRKNEIRDELRVHLDEHWDAIGATGGDRPQRIRQVLDDFGRSDRLAAAVARPYHRRAWRIAGLVAASLALAFVVQFRSWPVDPTAGRGWVSPTGNRPALAGSPVPLLAEVAGVIAGPSAAEDVGYQAFGYRIETVSFLDHPLEEVLAKLSQESGANIWVNWGQLQDVGIDGDSMVSMQLEDVSLARLLDLLCASLGEDEGLISFGYSDNVIEISTPSTLHSPRPEIDTVQAVYDVRAIVDAAEARWEKSAHEEPRRREKDPGCFPEPETNIQEDLCEIIRNSISPDMWMVNGGTQGTIQYFAGLLVIRAPVVVHARIADLLAQLQQSLGPQSEGAAERSWAESPLTGPTSMGEGDLGRPDAPSYSGAMAEHKKAKEKPAKPKKKAKKQKPKDKSSHPAGPAPPSGA